MKNLLFLMAVFCTLQANAQPYSISFAGAGLSSVKVENLTSGLIVNLSAGDVLHLSTTTGISEVKNLKSSGMKVYPNPMTDISTLEILPPVAGDAIISVYDITGKVLTQFKDYMENNKQEFSLSGIKNGFHVINVQGNGYQFSEKLLSNGKSNGTANISRISNNIQAVVEKKSINDSKGVQATVNMAYNTGERLKYTAVSGNNSTVITDIPTSDKTVTFTFTECKDGDNNYYPVVQINTQLWMAENLKTTKYNDGTTLPNITGYTAWAALHTGAYCDYNNTPSNSTTYGRLYNWYAVDNNATTKVASNDGKNVCPTGWHVPSDFEWMTLTYYLTKNGYGYEDRGDDIAKSMAATSGWATSETFGNAGNDQASNNSSGFTALPGGYRSPYEGTYYVIGYGGYWWSSSENYYAYSFVIWFEKSIVVEDTGTLKKSGRSVRCLKDN